VTSTVGWTSTRRLRGVTDRAFFEAEFPALLARAGRIVDCATVGGVFYAAVRNTTSAPHRPGETWALVVLEMDDRSGPAADHCPIRIVELLTPVPDCIHAENYCRLCGALITLAGPEWERSARPGERREIAGQRCYSGYPYGAAAGDGGAPYHEPGGVPPCPSCWAREWRDRCRARSAMAERARAVRPGTRIRFAVPIRFAGGDVLDTLIFEKRSTFRGPDGDGRYHIANWRTGRQWAPEHDAAAGQQVGDSIGSETTRGTEERAAGAVPPRPRAEG
jgi:hypothetical protein